LLGSGDESVHDIDDVQNFLFGMSGGNRQTERRRVNFLGNGVIFAVEQTLQRDLPMGRYRVMDFRQDIVLSQVFF
jgi:hypothetical protein